MTSSYETQALDQIAQLPCWSGAIDIAPLPGGMTNRNYQVRDAKGQYAVRLGVDIAEHGVMRFNELAVAKAAFAAGVAPEVLYGDDGVLVSRFITGRTLTAHDIARDDQLPRVVELVRRFHQQALAQLRGPVLAFYLPHVIANYLAQLQAAPNNPLAGHMPALTALAQSLQAQAGIVEMVLGHNDLLPANFIDDGQRLWLIDFDYAGLNTPLFDLANLSTNNNLSPEQDEAMLQYYWAKNLAASHLGALWQMKLASLLREVLWCGVSQITSPLGIDHTAYTQSCLARLEAFVKAGAVRT